MKKLLMLIAISLPVAAFAQATEPPPQEREAGRQARVDADRDCLRYTGTHLRDRDDRAVERGEVGSLDRDGCVAANGRVYSRRDLESTGATDIADALRRLDPAIR
ncbi:hypothetical protein LY625_11580 [Lysobacter sp. GX 14042]|uniref:hypothetical protein n=1 Tax=Lysobacter sp. GX 14042 TaxID=2907155 RepID=UPI001F3ACE49|nr:hypothetical protein [Lysobacter sp. GX 14042]MCE7033248.1 hypothetical protein [Lysobacter sp. GX 14042]